MPPSTPPPRILVGGSPPITIASALPRRAASRIPAPALRARITSGRTSTSSYSSPTPPPRARLLPPPPPAPPRPPPPRLLLALLRQLRVERQRQRPLDHVDDVH